MVLLKHHSVSTRNFLTVLFCKKIISAQHKPSDPTIRDISARQNLLRTSQSDAEKGMIKRVHLGKVCEFAFN